MINVTCFNISYNDEIKLLRTDCNKIAIKVEGHALFKRKGKDVVCAAVSALALNLLRSIAIIGEINLDYNLENGLLEFEIEIQDLDSKKERIVKILLESFIIGILDINKNYGLIDINTIVDNF